MKAERVRIGDVLELQRRQVVVEPTQEYRLVGVYSFGKGLFHRDPMSGADLGSYRFFAIEPGDLVLSNIQAWEGAIGLGAVEDKGAIGTHRFLTYAPKTKAISTNWVRWFLLSEPGMALIRQAAPGSTMRNRTLAIKRFEALEIPLPPIGEQRRIANRLDRLNRAVHGLMMRNASVAAIAGAPLEGWLAAQVEPLGIHAPLESVATVHRGRGPRYEPDTGRQVVNQACVRWSGLDLTQARESAEDWWVDVPERSRIAMGDVLVNSTGEGTIGRACLAPGHAVGLPIDSHVLSVRPAEALDPAFLALFIRSRQGQAEIVRLKGANTTKQTELGKKKLGSIQVPVPDLRDQREIVREFRQIEPRVASAQAAIATQGERIKAFIPSMLNDLFAA